ncbi:hypothetical protein LZ198_26585 [Myxococcus sp. K15C18031901]|uniref:hypothetical protein n=1 Tax=Myxococcus dinghuensis TaxID=2906761 RepID=UPI0020A6F373|nr:hypothetical protein [Myxococcus dinghuensis]MCP3102445.1 hypothetical protein [Myxococcus dinghuensis]
MLLLGNRRSDVGDSGKTDVGALPELAGIQARLRPLNACGIQYGERGRRIKSGSHSAVWVSACEQDRFQGIHLVVPAGRQVERVTFDMTRGSTSEPWAILVDKNLVAFPDLEKALEQLAPLIQEEAPTKLALAIEERAAKERQRQENEAAEKARREAAKDSYPK